MEGGSRAAVEDLRRQEQDLLSMAQIEASCLSALAEGLASFHWLPDSLAWLAWLPVLACPPACSCGGVSSSCLRLCTAIGCICIVAVLPTDLLLPPTHLPSRSLLLAEDVKKVPQVRHGHPEGGGLQQDGMRRLRRLLVLALLQGD